MISTLGLNFNGILMLESAEGQYFAGYPVLVIVVFNPQDLYFCVHRVELIAFCINGNIDGLSL